MSWGYPIFLDLSGKRCLVVGRGPLAEDKARALETAGASVVVIAPEEWTPAALEGCLLAFAATGDPASNAVIYEEGERRGVLVNSPDDPPRCRFILPSVHRQGDLAIAVSTGGQSPAVAVRIREELEARYGPEYAAFLELAGRLRERVKSIAPDFAARRALWYSLVDSEALEALREGDRERAAEALEKVLTGGRQP